MNSFKDIVRRSEKIFDHTKLKVKTKLKLFDPVIIYPYRGYGNQEKARLRGRILEKESIIHDKKELETSLWQNIKKLWKRFESDEVPGVGISATFQGVKAKTFSDDEGYFILEFRGLENLKLKNGWYEVDIQITDMPFDVEYEKTCKGEILICEQDNAFGIISDVDDTIIKSYATKTLASILTMLRHDSTTRTPFEGISNLYKGLIDNFKNPLFFVSGSSYNLYDLLVKFCEYHEIPKAPFFLRDIGIEAKQWIKQETMAYKKDYIRQILAIFPKLRFILIGDSGQHDPEIYQDIHKENPGRIMAIYIRHVHTNKRKEDLADISKRSDIPFLVIDHSDHALKHAKEMNWV